MIEKHILDFLKDNNRLIVPDLGAFIVKVNSADNSREITFNDVIKFNDNTFANFIANAENIDFDAAKQKIIEFVDKVTDELNEGNQVEIGTVGFLIKDSKGYVNFTSEKIETKTADKIVEINAAPSVVEEKKEEPIELIQEDIFASKPVEEKEFISPVKDKKIEEIYDMTAENEKQEKILKKQKEQEEKQRKEDEKKRKIEAEKEKEELKKKEKAEKKRLEEEQKRLKKAEKPQKSDKKKSKKGLFITISIVVLVAALGGIGFVFKHQIKEQIAKLTHKEVKIETPAKVDSIKVVPTPEENQAKLDEMNKNLSEEQKLLKDEENFVSVDIKFHVIAGSFETREQAAKYLIEIRNQGYDSKLLIARNKIRVTYGSFTTRAEAKAMLNDIKNKGISEVWMLAE